MGATGEFLRREYRIETAIRGRGKLEVLEITGVIQFNNFAQIVRRIKTKTMQRFRSIQFRTTISRVASASIPYKSSKCTMYEEDVGRLVFVKPEQIMSNGG